MIKILFAINILVIIIVLLFFVSGIECFKNNGFNQKGIKHILGSSRILGICFIIGAIIFVPTIF